MLVLPYLLPQIVVFKIVEIEPKEAVIITKNTSVEFSDIPEGVKKRQQNPLRGYWRPWPENTDHTGDDRTPAPASRNF